MVAVLAAGLLAAGCGSSITSSIGSLPSRTATVSGRPSVTAQPPTHSVTTAAPATGSAAPGASSSTSLTWLWVLLGVVVLAGLIALIARSGRRRSAAAAGWRSGLVDAYAKVPGGGRLKVPTPRVDQVLFRVVPFLALASRMQ